MAYSFKFYLINIQRWVRNDAYLRHSTHLPSEETLFFRKGHSIMCQALRIKIYNKINDILSLYKGLTV
jgi:hypothetical protein